MADLQTRKRRTLLVLLTVLAVMAVPVYYAVPLYQAFCQVTGFGGTTQRADAAPEQAAERVMTIRFVADTNSNLPWMFQPAQTSMEVRVGERNMAFFVAENRSEEAITGMAVFNVTPQKAGRYFNKIACFCFNQQTLEAGQRVDMPVSFFVDPEIMNDPNLDDVNTITLSYTFFRAAQQAARDDDANGERQ